MQKQHGRSNVPPGEGGSGSGTNEFTLDPILDQSYEQDNTDGDGMWMSGIVIVEIHTLALTIINYLYYKK